MKFRFWPLRETVSEEPLETVDTMEIDASTWHEGPEPFVSETAASDEIRAPLPLPEFREVMHDEIFPEKDWEHESERSSLSDGDNVVRLADVRHQRALEVGEEPNTGEGAQTDMTFTSEGHVGFADVDSYADTLSRYHGEVIRDGAQFTRQSINSLVEGYFNQSADEDPS